MGSSASREAVKAIRDWAVNEGRSLQRPTISPQIFGSLVICACTFGIALIVMYGVKSLGVLRVSEEVELGGLDLHEHGAPAYHPEFAYMGYSPIPSGKSNRPPGSVTIPADTSIGVGD